MIECCMCKKRGDARSMRGCVNCGLPLCDECAGYSGGLCDECADDE